MAAEIRLGVGRRAASRRQGALSPASGEPRPVRWRSGARRGGSCAEQSVQNLQPSEVDPSLDRGCRRGHTPRVVRARSTLATLLAASRDRVPGTDSRAWVAQGQWRIGRQPTRPVLKHGPRSLACARVTGSHETQGRNESEGRLRLAQARSRVVRDEGALPARLAGIDHEAEQERTRWDPKDGELCLSRTKSGETLMEVRSDSDVQIDRQTWV